MGALLWVLAALAALYLFLIAPGMRRPDASAFAGRLYAHRGLHGGDAPENSLAAFARAADAGFGIELDVQLTRDGRLVVHHDESLLRVCGADARIRDLTFEELRRHPLPDGSHVPEFCEVLALLQGRVPLLVEIKHYGGAEPVARAALEALRGYAGPWCVESFHPLAVRYFRRHAPHALRGQLVFGGASGEGGASAAVRFALRHLLVNFIGRPHFVARAYPYGRSPSLWLMRRLFRPLMAAWTLRTPEALEAARRDGCDMPIFEGFLPPC